METQVKAKVEVKEEVKVEEKVVREDLNDMVTSIKFSKIENRYGNDRFVSRVKLFNGESIDFNDKDGLHELLVSFSKSGIEKPIKSVKLVEEVKKSKVDTFDGEVDDAFNTYICVLYELIDDSVFRLFPARKYVDRRIIDNYYRLYKSQNVKKG